MKINFYLLQSQLNALKTPTQAIIAKENGIENNIRDALISSKEKHLPNVIIKELSSNLKEKIKTVIKETLDLDVKEVNIKIKNYQQNKESV